MTSLQPRTCGLVMVSGPDDPRTERARSHLRRWLRGAPSGMATEPWDLTINFHPDSPTEDGGDVLTAILASGRIQNRFESGLTNGFDTVSAADARRHRESMLFLGMYDRAVPAERPKYGAANLLAHPRGGSPRFGSCHWILDPALASRCTVTVLGSHSSAAWQGNYADLKTVTDDLVVRHEPDRHRFRLIDGPVELQIHGEVELGTHVTALVLDPSFRDTAVEVTALELAQKYGVTLRWGPNLQSCGGDWKIPEARAYALRRVRSAQEQNELINAEWIGRNPWPPLSADPPPPAVVSGARRYLWNRLLLTQETPPGHEFGKSASSDG